MLITFKLSDSVFIFKNKKNAFSKENAFTVGE